MKISTGLKYLILAGLVGLVAVFLVHAYINSKVPRASALMTGEVVVAEIDIAPGTALSSRLMRVASWPRDIIPSKTVSNLKSLEGRVVQAAIAKGEPILLNRLAPEGTAAGLGGLLDPNMLAVTVKTDEVSGVAGFINPGDRIDVLVEMSAGGGTEHFSKLILQNIKVLSKGQVWDQTLDKQPQVVPTVTVEVTAEQAEMLNLASFQGKIRLALRNQLNQAYFSTAGVVTSQLSHKKPALEPNKEAKPQRQARNVQVIKGTNISYPEM